MKIDILLNSCARPDVLDISFRTFKEKIKTDKHEFRWVILEDKVKDAERQKEGRDWIEAHKDEFDKIVYSEREMGFGQYWPDIVKHCESDFFVHMEDDQDFFEEINIDPLIDILEQEEKAIEIVFRRIKKQDINPERVLINGVELTKTDFMCNSVGVFKTKLVKDLFDHVGWEETNHEASILTPGSKDLNFIKYTLGYDTIHYTHVGKKMGYEKGSWKKRKKS